MFSRLLKRMRVTGPLVVLAIVTALAIAGVPVVADPVAQSASVPGKVVKQIKRSLGLSKRANKKATRALKLANQGGPAGPAGPKGDPGARGAQGSAGTNGTNGTDGTNGVSVTSANEPAGANCADGGSKFTAASGITYACDGADGADGQTGFTETLPSGETLTGTWKAGPLAAGPEVADFAPISFPIPLTGADAASTLAIVVPEGGPVPALCDDGVGTPPSATNPEADPGRLCVFTGFNAGAGSAQAADVYKSDGPPLAGVSSSGAIILYGTETGAEGAFAWGTFAVTAP